MTNPDPTEKNAGRPHCEGRIRLQLSDLPLKHVRAIRAFRRQLEKDAKPSTAAAAKRVHSACCCLAAVFRAQARLAASGLSADQVHVEEELIARSNEACHRHLAKLGLERDDKADGRPGKVAPMSEEERERRLAEMRADYEREFGPDGRKGLDDEPATSGSQDAPVGRIDAPDGYSDGEQA